MSNHSSQKAREMAQYHLALKNAEDGQGFYSPILKKFVTYAMIGGQRKLFEYENISEHHPSYKNLGIFGTKFGSALEDFLRDECPDISIFDDIIELAGGGSSSSSSSSSSNGFGDHKISFKEKKMIGFGAVQAGKTSFMTSTSILFQMFGISSIIMLRDMTIDRVQFCTRIKNTSERFQLFAETRGLIKDEHHFNITALDELSPVEDLTSLLKAKPASICVCISNESTMEKIIDALSRAENNSRFVLFIDEVDLVDSTTAGVRSPFLDKIKQQAEMVVGISASILGTAAEWNINPTCIRELVKPERYVGLDKIQRTFVNTGYNTTVKGSDIQEIYEAVPCLAGYLQDFSERRNVTLSGTIKPEIDLIRITTEIAPQRALRDEINNKFPTVATMLCVENGIDITHPCLGKKPIQTLDGKHTSKVIEGGKIHHFTNNVDIGAAMAIFENKGIEQITHILCIAGKKASRSVSFSSNIPGIGRWHVRRMLCKLSEKTSMDEIMQIAGRLCGVFETGLSQYMIASPTDLEAIEKAYKTQESLLNNTSRKYGKKVEAMVRKGDGSLKMVNIWKRNDVPVTDGMDLLLNNSELSFWKLSVTGQTPTGRPKKINKRLTMRNAVEPVMVEDDGRETKEDYEIEMEVKESHENGDCLLVIPSKLARQCKETYELVMEYMREENKSGWILRSTINKWLQEKNIGALDQITARFNHLQEKGVKCSSNDKGLIFKFEGGRWKVRLNM